MADFDHLDLYGISENEDEGSQEPIKLVKQTRKELREYRKPHEKDWITYENAYYGKHHLTGDEKKTVKNHIFKVVEGEVPILTDSIHGTQILAQREDRTDDAKNLERAIRYVYQENNLPLLLPTVVREALIAGPGFIYAYYDPDWNHGEGGIRYRQINWRNVLLDGNVSTIEESTKCQISFPMRRSEAARLYPDLRKRIMALPGNVDTIEEDDESNPDGMREDMDTGDHLTGQMGRPKDHKAKDLLGYTETWLKSYDLAPIDPEETAQDLAEESKQLLAGEAPHIHKWEDHPVHIQAHQQAADAILAEIGLPPGQPIEIAVQAVQMLLAQGADEALAQELQGKLTALKITLDHIEAHKELLESNPKGQAPKYKDGWRVIKSIGDLILEDGGNAEENGEIPLIPFYGYKDATIYGFGEVKNIHSPQMSLNRMDDKEYRSLCLNGNAGWIADEESGVNEEDLTDEEGLVIIKKKGTDVGRMPPNQVSPQFQTRKEGDKFDIEDISGIREASQGQMPQGGASGVAIERLQTQAVGRIRLKDRYLAHYSMKRLGKITASMVINHWSTERRLRLVVDNAESEELVWDPLRFQDLQYTVEIAPGSMAGVDKDQLNSFYYGMLKDGHINPIMFLTVADLPKKEILLEMIKEEMGTEQKLKELQVQNIQLKATISPELLTPEEQKVLVELQREELLNQALSGNLGAFQGQPEQGDLRDTGS